MLKRTITGVLLITVLVVVLLLMPAVSATVLVGLMVMVAADELLKNTGLVDHSRLILYAKCMAVSVVCASYFADSHVSLLVLLLVATALCFSEMLRTHGQLPFRQVAMTMVAGLLIPFLLSGLVRIRAMDPGDIRDEKKRSEFIRIRDAVSLKEPVGDDELAAAFDAVM